MSNTPTELTKSRVVAIGEVLVDEFPQDDGTVSRVPGGSPANTAVALARLGVPTALLSIVSTDADGLMILKHLDESGVELSLVKETDSPTTLAFPEDDGSGSMKYKFLIDGYSQGQWQLDHITSGLTDRDILCVSGSFALGAEPIGEVFETLFKVGSKYHTIVFDPNVRPDVIGDSPQAIKLAQERFDSWVGYSDVVKLSMEDAHWRYPDLDVTQIAAELKKLGTNLVIITDGAKGSYAFGSGSATAYVPAIKIEEGELKDTIGAGDTFNAGVIDTLIRQGNVTSEAIRNLSAPNLSQLLQSGTSLATQVCREVGANPPWIQQSRYDLGTSREV